MSKLDELIDDSSKVELESVSSTTHFIDENGRVFNTGDIVYFIGSHSRLPRNTPLKVMGITYDEYEEFTKTNIIIYNDHKFSLSSYEDLITAEEHKFMIIKEML